MTPPTDGKEATAAIFQAVVLTAFSDGHPDTSEARVVAQLLELDPRFARLDDALALGVHARVLLDTHGIEDALEQIVGPITTPADRRLAFQLCARIMVADGRTDGEEAMVLGTLQERFALGHGDVRAILDAERARKAE